MSRMVERLPSWFSVDADDLDAKQKPTHADVELQIAYAYNVIRTIEPNSNEAEAVLGWLARNRERLKLNNRLFTSGDAGRGQEPRRLTGPISITRWKRLKVTLRARVKRRQAKPASELTIGLTAVTGALGLGGLDAALFHLIYRYRLDNHFERLLDGLAEAQGRNSVLRRYPDLFALLIGGNASEINLRFRADAPLIDSGALRVDEDGDIQVSSRLVVLIEACAANDTDVRAELLGRPRKASLDWASFRHLGEAIEIARRVLIKAVAGGERGVHVLFYGPPGTGKTECAASLADSLGLKLHVIGENGPSGREPSRGDRLSDLLLAQRLAGDSGDTLYLFDEAEDLFRPRAYDREPDPKIFVHRLLETAKVPIIWAANDIEAFSPAVLRRMTQCIEVRLPPQSRRAELWQDLAEAENVELDAATALRLAR
ncbi:MAG TPA: AAA family ATPase, partial [Acidiphilium sp.]